MIKPFLVCLLLGLMLLVPGCKSGDSSTEDDSTIPQEPQIEDRLLTDAEMVPEEDPDAAAADPVWATWIKDNAVPVRSITHTDFSDLQFLKPLLANRTIVQLGENCHSVSEFHKAKVRLIKFLHEEMGFDVIAFESCMFNCFYTYRNVDDTPLNTLRSAIYNVWSCSEVSELFKYIEETRATERPLILAGFDMKSSEYQTTKQRPAFLRDIIAPLDAEYAEEVYNYDTEILDQIAGGGNATDYCTQHEAELKQYYRELLNFFDTRMTELLATFPDDPEPVLVARQVIWSALQHVDFAITYSSDVPNSMYVRDRAMGENLTYLAEQVYPGKKIITWGHNAHLRHDNESINGNKSMGAWVTQRHRPQLYTVGLYMYRGQVADNKKQAVNIDPPVANSLEAIAYRARLKYFFLDILHQTQEPGNSWMFQVTQFMTSGLYIYEAIFKDQYDAVLFIDTTRPPNFL